MGLILLIILIVLLVGAWPSVGLHPYGYMPVSALTVVLIVVLILFLLGRV